MIVFNFIVGDFAFLNVECVLCLMFNACVLCFMFNKNIPMPKYKTIRIPRVTNCK